MALSQAFMPNRQYNPLHEEDEDISSTRIKKPLILSISIVLALSILISSIISLNIVFPSEPTERPFCRGKLTPSGAFYLTEKEAADFYWFVVFLPTFIVFLASVLFLIAGISVAYSSPKRHFLLKIADNNFCSSRRGGVRCLSILNTMFAIVFSLMALFLGSTLLTLDSTCSVPLFVSYEISSFSLTLLHGFTAFSLNRGGYYNLRNLGVEMQITPEIEKRVNDGFKQWMGSSDLSSDDEDENLDDYLKHEGLEV